MGYERYPRGDYRSETQDYGRDYGSGRDYTYSSARDYAASGDQDDGRYGRRDYGYERYGQREQFGRERQTMGGYGRQDYGSRDYGNRDQGRYESGRSGYGARDYGRQDYGSHQGGDRWQGRGDSEYHGSYAHDGRRFEDVGRNRHADDDNYRNRQQQGGSGAYGRQPQGYDYEERGFFARAGDEVRSWFGDDDAERRREMDARNDDRYYGGGQHDHDYHGWRSTQIAALDRDYDEYRRENRSRFENEFSSWRTNRQGQRDMLQKVKEHQEVVGSDGSHVGTVDKVRGDRIILTKNDADAGGRHHSISSSWISSVDDKVTLSKTADEAKKAWRDEENNAAMFGDRDADRNRGDRQTQVGQTGQNGTTQATGSGQHSDTNLNRSFSGTY
ncbi:hypothetical protein GCM10011380_01080 [Sphingomonas metalli]|uniref:DUF2171 domain-containing protein n=1 Tax=Sphingomonas metalli TaxID=1779358 RepID=A0A916WMR1_9SPHN|nr:DUF2171 domain-containing protein [Sphingomonas metalli]GGB15425.1 hypothetical protein GCM10011380_01080 [Sphingomonas metalli]